MTIKPTAIKTAPHTFTEICQEMRRVRLAMFVNAAKKLSPAQARMLPSTTQELLAELEPKLEPLPETPEPETDAA
jgi:hypothetical protein